MPFGILGGRIYHVITDPELYFTHGQDPFNALRIWDGGLGIPGAIALGTLGAWIGCRRRGIRLDSFGDAAVPGVALAQAIGRLGNWFNNELYGRATTLPWKLQIHCLDVEQGKASLCPGIQLDRPGLLPAHVPVRGAVGRRPGRLPDLGRPPVRTRAADASSPCTPRVTPLGRFWVEELRSDHANHILGLRVNTVTMAVVFVGGVIWFAHPPRPGRGQHLPRRRRPADPRRTPRPGPGRGRPGLGRHAEADADDGTDATKADDTAGTRYADEVSEDRPKV